MGCGASKDSGTVAPLPPAAAPVPAASAATTPQATKAAESAPTPAPAPPKQTTPDPPASSQPPAKKGGAQVYDGDGDSVKVAANSVAGGPNLQKIVSFNSNEKSDDAKPRKVPDTPFVKKTADFEEMFDEEEEEEDSDDEGAAKKKKGKKKDHVNFGGDVDKGAEKKNMAPGTPFVRLGAAFDDLYDDEDDESEEEEEEDESTPAPKKKGKSAPVKFSDGTHTAEEDKQKEKLTPGTPFVKMGGGFDDLYDEDEDEDSDMDSDEEEAPKVPESKPDKPRKKAGFAGGDNEEEKPKKAKKKAGFAGGGDDADEAPREQKNPPKKKKAGCAGNVGFSGDTKEEEKESDFKQPGTPFVKLGGFNDLYDDEDEDEDSDEESDEEDEASPTKAKTGGGSGAVKFSDGTEDHNREDVEHVPGTPFVKLGAFNDLYDEDEDEEDDDSDEDEDEAPSKPAEELRSKPEPEASPAAPAVDPATLDMELPSIAKVKI